MSDPVLIRRRHPDRTAAGPARAAAGLAALLCALAVAGGCASGPMTTDGGPAATATLSPTAGNTAAGTVRFAQHGARTQVEARLTGLAPNSEHGLHVHEKGECGPDGTAAGGHFNPRGQPHAFYGKAERHAGDMPNVRADANGVATLSWESELLTVADGPASVIGRSVVLHRDADDYASQPAGNSGPRLACGVVSRG